MRGRGEVKIYLKVPIYEKTKLSDQKTCKKRETKVVPPKNLGNYDLSIEITVIMPSNHKKVTNFFVSTWNCMGKLLHLFWGNKFIGGDNILSFR